MISREGDVNTPAQLAFAMCLSALAHAVLFAGVIAFSSWTPKRRIIVPGYKVDLVTLAPSTPASLLPPGPPSPRPVAVEPEKPKPAEAPPTPEPKVKVAPPPPKKVKPEPMVKEKTAAAPKKIVAKSDDQPKKEARRQEDEKDEKKTDEPLKTKPLPPIETASIPSGTSSAGVPRSSTPGGGGGGGGGGAVTEGLTFPHIWYLQILERKANENWITHGIIIAGKRADPVVRFHILKNGGVDDLELEKSSGNAALDESALTAISKASPFPPLPADYGSDHLTVHFTFTYEQRD